MNRHPSGRKNPTSLILEDIYGFGMEITLTMKIQKQKNRFDNIKTVNVYMANDSINNERANKITSQESLAY